MESWRAPAGATECSFALSGLYPFRLQPRVRFAHPGLLSDRPSGASLRPTPPSGRLPEATRSAGGDSLFGPKAEPRRPQGPKIIRHPGGQRLYFAAFVVVIPGAALWEMKCSILLVPRDEDPNKWRSGRKMPMSYLLALDQGTTSSRAVAFLTPRAPVHAAAQRNSPRFSRARVGWSTRLMKSGHRRSPLRSKRCRTNASRSTTSRPSASPTSAEPAIMRGSAQPEAPVYNAIVWQDRRTADSACDALEARRLRVGDSAKDRAAPGSVFFRHENSLDSAPGQRAEAPEKGRKRAIWLSAPSTPGLCGIWRLADRLSPTPQRVPRAALQHSHRKLG